MRDSFDPEYLTLQQVAQLAQISYKTVWRAVKDRRLRAVQPSGAGPYRVYLEDYDAWMRGVTPSPRLPERHITRRSA